MIRSLKALAVKTLPQLFGKSRDARMPRRQRFVTQFEYRYLRNGKYRGVIVWGLAGRFSSDDVERFCEHERDTKEQALNDARGTPWL